MATPWVIVLPVFASRKRRGVGQANAVSATVAVAISTLNLIAPASSWQWSIRPLDGIHASPNGARASMIHQPVGTSCLPSTTRIGRTRFHVRRGGPKRMICTGKYPCAFDSHTLNSCFPGLHRRTTQSNPPTESLPATVVSPCFSQVDKRSRAINWSGLNQVGAAEWVKWSPSQTPSGSRRMSFSARARFHE